MYWELRKKMPEIIEKATQQAVAEAVAEAMAEAVPKAVAEAVAEARQKERARFKRFCEKHGIPYTEEDWTDEALDDEDS